MPRLPEPKTVSWWAVAIFLTAICAALFWISPWAPIFVVAIAVWGWAADHFRLRKLSLLASERSKLSICQFSRSFDTKVIDTWVIRAVYEEVQGFVYPDKPDFPISSEDDLIKDLLLDEDDVDLEIVAAVGLRTGRSLENFEHNPYFQKVNTVGDLVLFFNAQPLQEIT